ncbi:MAG: serine/threonine-protein kinase [Nocardioidaceae bacterium]
MSLPHRLGRLRRISRIGSGGFATVWLYADPDLQSQVAVKALADNWASRTDIRDRFLEEARILRRADSDNIVRVYDLGETDDGTPYFVMNYADRGTIADLLNAPSRDLPTIVDLVSQAGRGLMRLHSMGILHRDVKPQNLLLSSDPSGATRLMVADLGVAKAMLHASGITQVVGTPAYMAPEQADPTGGVDARCDVHALGAVAYHLVTGRPMRTGGFESLFQPDPIRPPSTLVPGLPTSLDQVLLRAVAFDPDQRWPDVDTFGAAFATAATASHTQMYAPPRVEARVWQPGHETPQNSPVPGSPVPPVSPPVDSPVPSSPVPSVGPYPAAPDVRAANRRRNVLAVVAAVAVVAVVMGVTLIWQASRDTPSGTVVGPSIALGDGWSDPADAGYSTWQYTNQPANLQLLVSTETSDRRVQDEATAYAATLDDEEDATFSVQGDRALTAERLGDWEVGWDLRYSGENTEQEKVYYWRWYFGNSTPETAGFVELRSGEKGLANDPDAEELLEQAREDAIIGIG